MSLPRYPNYKDSGVEWLGEVPGYWTVTKTKHVLQFTTGWTPPTGDSASFEGENLWANISDLGPKWIGETAKRVSDLAINTARIAMSPKGSLLFSFKLSIGQVSFAAQDMYTNEAIATFLPSPGIDLSYAYYVFPLFLVQNASVNIYGAKLLNQELIRSASFAIPPLPEQTQIAAFLDRETAKIDELVAEQRRLMDLLKEKRQAVISHAVTRGLNPNAPLKPSGIEWLGDVPEHWEVKQIRQFAEILRGKFTHRPRNDPAFYDGDYPFIQTGDVTGTSRFITEYKQTLNERGILVSKQFPKGTLVMTIAANIGDVAVLDFPAYFPDSIVGLVPSPKSELMFLFYLMMAMKQPLEMNATVSTQMNLNVEQIASLSSACPPSEEQRAIVTYLDKETAKLDILTTEAQRAIDLLQERRTALISAAVTGQIDVRGAVAA